MALLDIPLDRITEADVRRLIAAGAAESLYIDYKQATYGGKEADHAELLADVSSFANTARQSGWKRCGELEGQFGGRGEEMIVAPRQ